MNDRCSVHGGTRLPDAPGRCSAYDYLARCVWWEQPRCQGCEDAPLGQHTGPHDWELVEIMKEGQA